jgi:predicted phosphodiesterase
MRLALLSDIHGNSVALDAVIADARAVGPVDRWWVLGDIVAIGPDPVGVLERLAALAPVECLAGNADRYVLTGDRPYPQRADVEEDPSLLARFEDVTSSLAWTRGAVTEAGWFDWLGMLPATLRLTLPDGTRLLGVHATPPSDHGPGIDPFIGDAELGSLLSGCDADIVIGGHTHEATDRVVDGVRAVNLGSVGNSHRPDRAATYVLLDAREDGYEIEHRVVAYDLGAAARAIDAAAHPTAAFLRGFLMVADQA